MTEDLFQNRDEAIVEWEFDLRMPELNYHDGSSIFTLMNEGQIIVPLLIILAIGIFVGTRIWIVFKKE